MQRHLYFTPITAIYRIYQAKKRTNKHEKRVQQPRGPYKVLRSANSTERLFVAIANLKDSRGEKAKAKKILKRGVTGVGGIPCHFLV